MSTRVVTVVSSGSQRVERLADGASGLRASIGHTVSPTSVEYCAKSDMSLDVLELRGARFNARSLKRLDLDRFVELALLTSPEGRLPDKIASHPRALVRLKILDTDLDPEHGALDFIRATPNLETLGLTAVRAGLALDALAALRLSRLSLAYRGTAKRAVVGLELVTESLTDLTLISNDADVDLSRFVQLRRLRLADGIRSIAGLESDSKIEQIALQSRRMREADMAFVADLKRLEDLKVWSPHLATLEPIANCARLERLDITDCTRIGSLAPLADLANLRVLGLSGMDQVKDLSPLIKLKSLEEVQCYGRRRPDDVTRALEARGVRVLGLMQG